MHVGRSTHAQCYTQQSNIDACYAVTVEQYGLPVLHSAAYRPLAYSKVGLLFVYRLQPIQALRRMRAYRLKNGCDIRGSKLLRKLR